MHKFHIAGFEFSSKTAFIKATTAHLNSLSPDEIVTDSQWSEILTILFLNYPKKVRKLDGREILHFEVEPNPVNQCFAARVDPSERIHFGIRKSVTAFCSSQISGDDQ